MALNKEFYLQTTLPGHSVSLEETPIPSQIGPYKIESLLSQGGMSVLYLAKHPDRQQLIAIKVLSPRFVTHNELKSQFLKEAEIISLTDHPNIVKLYGQGEWEGGLYIAMEFIRGISLKQFIIQHSLSLRRSLDIILQVAYALLHLHTHGVIHRDLKPENILITESGQIKVIDFGVAQLQSSANSPSKGLVGTPSYMSPEMKSSTTSSFTSDIYALGIIAYELIIGKLSFGTIQLNLLPKNIRLIIQKALQPDPAHRYQDIVDFITDISQYLKKDMILSERSEKDEMKEMIESLTQSQRSLLPATIPSWNEIEIGLAKTAAHHIVGFSYDFVRFDDRRHVVIVAESLSQEIESISYISFLKGLLKMSFHEHQGGVKRFDPSAHLTLINEKIFLEQKKMLFRFGLLFLDASIGEFHFIGCGYPSIWHLSETSKTPRLLKATNPLLGETLSFAPFEINDSWKEGEQIFFHTAAHENMIKEDLATIEALTKAAISENLAVSSQTASDNILKKLILHLPNTFDKGQTLVLSIQRID